MGQANGLVMMATGASPESVLTGLLERSDWNAAMLCAGSLQSMSMFLGSVGVRYFLEILSLSCSSACLVFTLVRLEMSSSYMDNVEREKL